MISYLLQFSLIMVVFSFFWKEGFLYRGAEALLIAVVISLLIYSSCFYFLLPQINIASSSPFRFIWFGLGLMILIGEMPRFNKISYFPMHIFVGLGSGILIIGIIQGFMLPQLGSTLFWNVQGKQLILVFISLLSTLIILFFIVHHRIKKIVPPASFFVFFGKLMLYFLLGIMFSGLIFSMAAYLSGRIAYLFLPIIK
ncbi:MAG: hypothetical protein ACP5FK_02215 [bacterium]